MHCYIVWKFATATLKVTLIMRYNKKHIDTFWTMAPLNDVSNIRFVDE